MPCDCETLREFIRYLCYFIAGAVFILLILELISKRIK